MQDPVDPWNQDEERKGFVQLSAQDSFRKYYQTQEEQCHHSESWSTEKWHNSYPIIILIIEMLGNRPFRNYIWPLFVPGARRGQGTMLSCVRVRL